MLFIVRRARRQHIGAAAVEIQIAVEKEEGQRAIQYRAPGRHAPDPAQEERPDLAALQAHRNTLSL